MRMRQKLLNVLQISIADALICDGVYQFPHRSNKTHYTLRVYAMLIRAYSNRALLNERPISQNDAPVKNEF